MIRWNFWHLFAVRVRCIAFLTVLSTLCIGTLRSAPFLELALGTNNSPWLSLPPVTNIWPTYEVQRSTNLAEWQPLGFFLHYLGPYEDRSASQHATFYRAIERLTDYTNSWANQFTFESYLTKFIFLTNNPDSIFFHPSDRLHHSFVSSHFPEFRDLNGLQLDDIALYPSRQKIVLGGLIRPNLSSASNQGLIGLEFVSAGPFPPEKLIAYFKAVVSRMSVGTNQVVYVPPITQREAVLANRDFFEANGVPIRDISQLLVNAPIHSEAWAIGTLRYFPAGELEAAIAAGRITPQTILLTDFTPRELPPIAGLISLNPSSPNSHTVLRLRSASLPYLDLPGDQRTNAFNLVDKEVLFATFIPPSRYHVYTPPYGFHLMELATLPTNILAELRSRQSPAVVPPPMQRLGKYSTGVSSLNPGDIRYVGSKAVNYGVIVRSIPSDPGAAFTFDLWLDFMQQTLSSGKTLRQEIDDRLAPLFQGTNAHLAGPILESVRDLITDQAVFTSEQQTAIRKALAFLDPSRKIRFRSSSNCEDLPRFSAAGLHDSYSGCLLDDELPDQPDSCRCDPLDDKRRSVFRAIQKVYASFYNEQAFLERRKFNIDEATVGMAVLVHHSFPDEIELANGVANIEFFLPVSFTEPARIRRYALATQRGAVSVVNPETPDQPEQVQSISSDPLSPSYYRHFLTYSTIRPPMTPVLKEPEEYEQLLLLFSKIASRYPWTSDLTTLNFEYKKTTNGLVVKQVRPVYTGTRLERTIFFPTNLTYLTYQGMIPMDYPQGTLESLHRLKSIWEFESPGGTPGLSNANFAVFAKARGTYLSNGKIVTNEFHFVSGSGGNNVTNQWYYDSTKEKYAIIQNTLRSDSGDEFLFRIRFLSHTSEHTPFADLSDIMLQCERPGSSGIADLAIQNPAYTPTWPGTNLITTNHISIRTTYNLQFHPRIPIVGMGGTADLKSWHETVIAGLTTEPFTLKGYFSQTYKPSRHNFTEDFLFEPGLEEGISAEILEQLRVADIKQIHFFRGGFIWTIPGEEPQSNNKVELIGFDGSRRPVRSFAP